MVDSEPQSMSALSIVSTDHEMGIKAHSSWNDCQRHGIGESCVELGDKAQIERDLVIDNTGLSYSARSLIAPTHMGRKNKAVEPRTVQ
jgi:hypothetical protein